MTETKKRSVEGALRAHTGATLFGSGLLMLGLGTLIVPEDASSVALVVMGGAALILGAIISRAEGQLKFGPGGLEVLLSAVRQESDEAELNESQTAEAVQAAVERYLAFLRIGEPAERAFPSLSALSRSQGSLAAGTWFAVRDLAARELARDVVDDVAEMEDIPVADVPADALEAIRNEIGLSVAPDVHSAKKRSGRGAPKWHLVTHAGRWRVSHTRHGWTASRL